jgi:ubiquinone/menaquinone biosynthesis C-methylase UbiE
LNILRVFNEVDDTVIKIAEMADCIILNPHSPLRCQDLLFWKNKMTEDVTTNQDASISRTSDDKYRYSAIVNQKKINKGQTRWNQFYNNINHINPEALAGPILDFGSGVGYFVLEGLRRHMDIWGVDLLPGKIRRYKKLVEFTESPDIWKNLCVVGNGEELPFRSNRFAAISSWYVFEHIEHPGPVLRELVRITRSKGLIVIRAQDARNGWEGHCKIPWIPFLAGRLARVWVEEFGKSVELRRGVFDITQPQIISVLEELDCSIVIKAADPFVLIKDHWKLSTEEEVRRKARETKRAYERGDWQPQMENLYIYAQKN